MGDVSVMPQAWMMLSPYLSRNLRISSGGQELPPTTTARKLDMSIGFWTE